MFAAGAAGELFPILIISLFLTERGNFIALASVGLVGVLAIVLSAVPSLARSSTVQRIIREGQDATGQTTLRWAVVLLFLLLAIASRFGLDVVLGALLAGNRPRAALAAGLPARAPGPAASGDDVHHRDHAAADRPGRDRPATGS